MSDAGADALRNVRIKGDPTLNAIVEELIGCAWGRKITTPDDTEPCPNQAHTVVVVHDGDFEAALKLCQAHNERILAETTPHTEPDPT